MPLAGRADSPLLQRLAEIQLSYTKDFTVLHTLSSQLQIGCSVGCRRFAREAALGLLRQRDLPCSPQVAVVYARTLGTSKRVYAAKTMTKSSAMKLEGVRA